MWAKSRKLWLSYGRKAEAWFIRLLHLKDSTHRVALGAAIGMFIAFTPTVGVQMLLVLFITWLIPANRTAGIPMVWITNPFTVVPIYTFNYELGKLIVGSHSDDLPARLTDIWHSSKGFFVKIGAFADLFTKDFAWPLWVGSLIVGAVTGVVTYIVMYYLVDLYRRRHRAAQARKMLQARLRAPEPDATLEVDTKAEEESEP